MATVNEFSIWEPTIYELETTDPVLGGPTGISNLSRQQLANRTKKIFDILKLNGIFLTESQHFLAGQLIDVDAAFEPGLTQGTACYFNETNQRYERAQANTGDEREVYAGFVELTESIPRLVSGGLADGTIVGGTQGDILYVSATTPGQITLTPTNVPIGRILYMKPWIGPSQCVVSINLGAGFGAGGGFDPEQDTYRMLLNDSYYNRGSWDNFANLDLINQGSTDPTHDAYNQWFAYTNGQDVVSLNLRDPLASGNVTQCFVSVEYWAASAPTIWVTANGGANWESVSNNTNHVFANQGTDLRIWVRGVGSGTLKSWGILYEPKAGGGTVSIPHSALIQDEPQYHFTVGSIAHSAINDNEAAKHRIINDGGTSTTQLWSSQKINNEIAAVAGGGIRQYEYVFPILSDYWEYGAVSGSWRLGMSAAGAYSGGGANDPTPAYVMTSLATYGYQLEAQWYWKTGDPRYVVMKGNLVGPGTNGIRLNIDGAVPAGATFIGTGAFTIYIDVQAYGAGWHTIQCEHYKSGDFDVYRIQYWMSYWNTVIA